MVRITGPSCELDTLSLDSTGLGFNLNNLNLTHYYDSTDDLVFTWTDDVVMSNLSIPEYACGDYIWKFKRGLGGDGNTSFLDSAFSFTTDGYT